jgi:hypothetical protein
MRSGRAQREIKIELEGEVFIGRCEVQNFNQGGHAIVVYYRGKTATDRIPPEVNDPSYTDFLGQLLLKRLVGEEKSSHERDEEAGK